MTVQSTASLEFQAVRMADLVVSNNPRLVLTTHYLGSCLAVTIYDPVVRAGGLLHAMLPDSSVDPVKAAEQPAMFIDTGIPVLFRAAYQLGAQKHRVLVCCAGGAQIMDSDGFFSIGKRNYEAFLQICQEHNLRLQAEQTGGLVSRSLFLHIATGEVWMKVSGHNKLMMLCKSSTTT
jgi:chemotaxis protein CheD